MKNKKDSLIGRAVIVHPDITTDPLKKAGETAIIIDADLESETLMLKFADNLYGKYQEDTVLALYPKNVLLHALHANRELLTLEEYRNVSGVFKRAANGETDAALQLAVSTPLLTKLCTITCYDLRQIKTELRAAKVARKNLRAKI